ncbi:hypothetical protein AGMMS49546_06470 [Spirochaetia bacterium]|nr:hypothetical protein AGMMS49546_06470 [Spirochaetia bacterium]
MLKPESLSKYFAALLLLGLLFAAAGYSVVLTYPNLLWELRGYSLKESRSEPGRLYNRVENALTYALPFRNTLLRDIHSSFLVYLGKRESRNFAVLKDDLGFLHHGDYYQRVDPNIMGYAKMLRSLKDTTGQEGGRVLLVGGIDKYLPEFTRIHTGYPLDLSASRNMDEFMLDLFSNGVETLDLRPLFESSGLEYERIYYKTDAGWTIPAAFAAAGMIADTLEQKFGFSLDPEAFYRNIKNYREILYPDALQGVYGRTVGIPFGGLDDYRVLLPNFATSLSLFSSPASSEAIAEGPFEQCLLDNQYLVQSARHRLSYVYLRHVDADTPIRRIVNHSRPGGARVLLIGGGAGFIPTAAYLSLMCGELTFLSSASRQFGADIEGLLAENSYDCVIFGVQVGSIGETMFPLLSKSEAGGGR